MANTVNTEVIDFTGGMHTVAAPHLIAKSESRALVNVDIREGSLLSVANPKYMRQAMGSYFLQFNGEVYYFNNYVASAILGRNLYWTDGNVSGKIMYDGRELPIGIKAPLVACTLSEANAGAGEHSGDFKYTYTFYDPTTDAESAPAPLPPYITVDKADIVVKGLEPLPEPHYLYRVYRIGGYLAEFTMVAELTDMDIPYTDSLDDTEIDGRLLQTLYTGSPIAGMHYFTEMGSRLFGANGSKLYFSALGNPDSWYASDFFILPDRITGLAKVAGGLLIFGEQFTYILTGYNSSTFRLKSLSNKIGCISGSSIAYMSDKAIWLAEFGIYSSDGYRIIPVTPNKISSVARLHPTSAMILNDTYYLHFKPALVPAADLFPSDTLYPAAAMGVNELQEGIIVIDFKRGNGYSYQLLSFQNVASVGIINNRPYCTTETPNIVFLDCDGPLECDEFLQCSQYDLNLLGDSTYDSFARFSYLSPQFIDGSFSTLKQYDKVRVNCIGEFNVKVIFSSGEVVADVDIKTTADDMLIELLSGQELSFDRDNVTQIGIPNNNNLSYSIAFLITGIGNIKSIQYSWKNRELP